MDFMYKVHLGTLSFFISARVLQLNPNSISVPFLFVLVILRYNSMLSLCPGNAGYLSCCVFKR